MFISVNGTNIRNIVEYTNVYSTSASMNSLRGFRPPANAMSSVLSCQPHSPRASKVSDHLLRIARRNGLCVISERRAPAIAVVSGDGYGLRLPRFSIQSLQHGHLPRVHASETHGIRAARVEDRVRDGDNPAFPPVSPVRACRVPHAADRHGQTPATDNPRSIGTQIRPRPAFLMRPSAVSDSTILSSTPLMKVLLPGVE